MIDPTTCSDSDPSAGHDRSADRSSPDAQPLTWKSADILQGNQLVLIEHHDEIYLLRVTRQGKLILNK